MGTARHGIVYLSEKRIVAIVLRDENVRALLKNEDDENGFS